MNFKKGFLGVRLGVVGDYTGCEERNGDVRC